MALLKIFCLLLACIFISSEAQRIKNGRPIDTISNKTINIPKAFDEEGKPFFEEDKFKLKEMKYYKNSWNEANIDNSHIIQMNGNSSLVFTQKNSNRIQDLNFEKLKLYSAMESESQEIFLEKKYKFDKDNCLKFHYNYNDMRIKEFVFAAYVRNVGTVRIKGPDLDINEYFSSVNKYNYISFSLNKIGRVDIEFSIYLYEGEFFIFPLGQQSEIINFNEGNYIFEYNLNTKNKKLIIKYNLKGLTEDKIIYFTSNNPEEQFEICEESSNECNFIKHFYKFIKNKEYTINVYSYGQGGLYIIKEYIFGVFDKQNIQDYSKFEFGIFHKDTPYIYSLPKTPETIYLVNPNISDFYYSEDTLSSINEILETLTNMDFTLTTNNRYEYHYFSKNTKNFRHIFVIPKFNSTLKSFENYSFGFSNKLFVNSEQSEEIDFGKNGNGFIILEGQRYKDDYPLEDYNFLRVISSKYNNMRTIDSRNYFIENQKIISINSDIKIPNCIWIDKIPDDNNIIKISYHEPKYAYFYGLSNYITKFKFPKEKGVYSYFERINTISISAYDFFNYITFDLDDEFNIYTKKYYGYSTLYEIENEIYNMTNISFLEKPVNTFRDKISKFNKLFTLKSNQLYSGYFDYDTLYDIYVEIDNDNEIVELLKEDNEYNNLMKLFKPNINYKLNFEVNHLIKLEPDFDTEVTIKDSENHNIILNKNNPVTKEIKGNNVQITTNSNSILYFYSPISSLPTKVLQYEIIPIKGKNIILTIEHSEKNAIKFYYLIDFGFEGYSPLLKQSKNFDRRELIESRFELYIPNYYDKLESKLVQNEKLYLYYYLENDIKVNISSSYYQSINLNKTADFFVIEPNKEGEAINIMYRGNINIMSLQVYYCLNNKDSNIYINYDSYIGGKQTVKFSNSQISVLYGKAYNMNLQINSNKKFVLSYSIYDENDASIIYHKDYFIKRGVNSDLLFYANIIPTEKTLNIKFILNYINSSTKYYIIIGPKNEYFNLDNFNDPCFLTELITENSNKVIINVLNYVEEKKIINTNIDIKDLMVQYDDNQEYLVNIISQELRFDKKLNFYKAMIVKRENEISIAQEVLFQGETKFKLSYSRPENKNQICFFLSGYNPDSYKLLIEKQNSESTNYIINKKARLVTFKCDYDGIYNISIIPLSESSIEGKFKIFTTGIPFNLDVNEYLQLNFNYTMNYQQSNLNIIVTTEDESKQCVKLEESNLKINFKYNNATIPNEIELFCFTDYDEYEFDIEFLEPDSENQKINYLFQINDNIKFQFNNLVLLDSPQIYTGLNYLFLKIDYKRTPRFIIETNDSPKFYLANNISVNDFLYFPKGYSKYKFDPLQNLTIIKQKDLEYSILLINFESKERPTIILFKEIIENISINFDEFYEINIVSTDYYFEYDKTYPSDIIMLTYNLTKNYTGEIIITDENEIKRENIQSKSYGKLYFELTGENRGLLKYKLNFKNFAFSNNYGIFKITRLTGVNYKIDINQDIIEFDRIEAHNETGPLIIDLPSLQSKYFKKFYIESGNIFQFISIKKYNSKINSFYDNDFVNLNNKYYYFENNNSYYIQVKFIKVEKNYILYPFKLIELHQKNIIRINKSENISYNKGDIDKFILLDFGQFSTIVLSNLNSKIKMAYINHNQYQTFPQDIQSISFEKIDKYEIEINKTNNDNYIVLLIDLEEIPANIKIQFEIKNDESKNKRLSTLHIVLISVSCVIFVVIVIVVIIVIKKKKQKDINAQIGSLNSQLMDIAIN